MNERISQIVSRLRVLLEQAVRDRQNINFNLPFHPRHAEQLAAAGFGYPSWHAYLAAANAKVERCSGYYVSDIRMITARMIELDYSEPFAAQCAGLFVQAVSNGDGSTRADLADDLQGKRLRDRESDRPMYNLLMSENLTYDVMREESRLWTLLANFGIAHDGETEGNCNVSIDLPHDFPAHRHLGKTIDLKMTALYDLDQGADIEELFYGRNRQLGFLGNVRLTPSGLRGWSYPTIGMEMTPFVDHRNAYEIQGNYNAYDAPDIDKQEFDDGYTAGMSNILRVPHATIDWLAGWIMVANGANATGHMSTGQVDKALADALANAYLIDTLRPTDALHLAAQACRYYASPRTRPALEELIREHVDQLD